MSDEELVPLCLWCDKPLERKRLRAGHVESLFLFVRRRYCSRECFHEAQAAAREWGRRWLEERAAERRERS